MRGARSGRGDVRGGRVGVIKLSLSKALLASGGRLLPCAGGIVERTLRGNAIILITAKEP